MLTEVDILSQVVHPSDGNIPREMASFLLGLKFDDNAIQHMSNLALRHNQGELTTSELQEMERYRRVGNFLNLLHAKARLSLQSEAN
ncbi:MAG: hypothetical protein F6K09_33740 [Merismopedia sp. SIO2A8]|nr:hypothetical protein [Symploca sp. SIO2B6]NET53443.1 hypothetical protein [Merismopedia sp. SIO2A8]